MLITKHMRFGFLFLAMILALSLFAVGCAAGENNDAGQDTENVDNGDVESNETNNGETENGEEGSADDEEAAPEADHGLDVITGIDAGAGVMQAAEAAIEEYGLDIELQPSSDAAMTAALESAYNNEDPIVVTGWEPHWKFATYDLKYLDDPQGVFGEAESIHTIVRQGLEEDHPAAYTILDQFYWTPDDMNAVMVDIAQNGMEPSEAAQAWIDENQDQVDEWTAGVEAVDGDAIELVYVAWDSEVASHNVLNIVLEDMGYDVELTPLEAGPMWTSVATGESDATAAAWLPDTHESYYEDYGEDVIDLGANLDGAKIGLVVPEYMDIDSIEDLQ